MTVSVATPWVLQLYTATDNYTISLHPDSPPLLSAVTCPHKPDFIWFITSRLARRLDLPPYPSSLSSHFLSEQNPQSHPRSPSPSPFVFGTVLCTEFIACDDPEKPCSCLVRLCTSRETVRLHLQSGKLIKDPPLLKTQHPIAYRLPLSLSTKLEVSINGRVTLRSPDSTYSPVFLAQIPIFIQKLPNFILVVGCFRGAFVISTKHVVQRFLLPGSRERLYPNTLMVDERTDSLLILEELNSGHRSAYQSFNDGSVHVNLDLDRKLESSYKVQNVDYSIPLKRLLTGIEEVAAAEHAHVVQSAVEERRLAAYNAALVFVAACRAGREDDIVQIVENAWSVDVVEGKGGDTLGKDVLVRVQLRNISGVSLEDGWMMRMTIRGRRRRKLNDVTVGGDHENEKTAGEDSEYETHRIILRPLEVVLEDEQTVVDFPLTIDSHAPLVVDLALVFHHPEPIDHGDFPVDVVVKMCDGMALDVLYLSKPTKKKNAKDTSYKYIKGSQVDMLIGGEHAQPTMGYLEVMRFDVPVSMPALMKILKWSTMEINFESLLGAQFSTKIDAAHNHASDAMCDDEESHGCIVTIRGMSHVVPFVRAAILHRISLAGKKDKSLFQKIIIRGRTHVDSWKRNLERAEDECWPLLRQAEDSLVKRMRMFEENENGFIDQCADPRENQARTSELQKIRSLYGTWRRQTERLWTPVGSARITTKEDC